MKLSRSLLAAAGAAVLLASLSVGTPASAAVPSAPLTCGMVVERDMNLYLPKDLRCSTFGVRVQQDQSADVVVVPHVVVDLRGHTLSGSKTSDDGITAFGYPGYAEVTVTHGTVKNFDVALGGDTATRARRVVLADSNVGFFCNGSCEADLVLFKGNKTGLNGGGESSARVTRSSFVRNATGATVSFPWSLSVDHTLFTRNTTGIDSSSRPEISSTLFVRNTTAIRQAAADGDDYNCADLTRVRFARNQTDVEGPVCR